MLLLVPATAHLISSLASPRPLVVLAAEALPAGVAPAGVDIWVRPQPGWEHELATRLTAFAPFHMPAATAASLVARAEALATRHAAVAQAARLVAHDQGPATAARHAAQALRQLLDADLAGVYSSSEDSPDLHLIGSSPERAPMPRRMDAPVVDPASARGALVPPSSLGGDLAGGDWLVLAPAGESPGNSLAFALKRSRHPWSEDERDFASDLAEVLAVAIRAACLVGSLQSSEARYRGLFDNVAAAVIVTDSSGWIRLMNRRAVEVTGFPRGEAEGKLRLPIFAAPEEWGRISRTIATMPTGMGNFGDTNEYDCVMADGRRRRLRAQILPSPGSDEHLITFVDITVERDLHRQLLQAEKIASLGQLVSGVAHELNNPLGAILGSAELALEQQPSPAIAESLHRVVDQTERCRGIIANLLTFARERQAERLPVDVNAVVVRALDLQAYALSVDDIQVDLNLARDLPFVLGDPARLQQVVLNLILNAHHAMSRRGRGRLSFVTAARHHRVLLTVSDTGPGISAANLARIFDPFFSTKPVGEGTGLGLAVSMGIVLDLGGDMWAESLPGHGARFYVELPEATFAPVAEPIPSPAVSLEATPAPSLGVRVLLIEDEVAVRDVIECVLEAEGYLVQTAPDGQDAVIMLATTDFDAVLCDLRTPRMDGIHLYRHVAKHNPGLASRFVIITGDAASDYTRRFLDSVGVPVLLKPFSLTALRRLVLEVTSRPR